MTSSSDTGTGLPESVKTLLKGYKYINGTIDFQRLVNDEGLPTVAAARKRFKRAFEAHNLDVSTFGDTIGYGAASPQTTAATPTRKAGSGSAKASPSAQNPAKGLKRTLAGDGSRKAKVATLTSAEDEEEEDKEAEEGTDDLMAEGSLEDEQKRST